MLTFFAHSSGVASIESAFLTLSPHVDVDVAFPVSLARVFPVISHAASEES